MKFEEALSLSELAERFHCSFVGDPELRVSGINEIHRVVPGDIVFVDHPKYYDKALQSAATIVLINKEVACPEGKALLISESNKHFFCKSDFAMKVKMYYLFQFSSFLLNFNE